jgi:hypothetical protein
VGRGKVGFGKQTTATAHVSADASVTIDLYWESGTTAPTAPPTGYEDYVRASELDLDFGLLGKYYAWIKAA